MRVDLSMICGSVEGERDVGERGVELMCCDTEGEGRISPAMLMLVVGDMGAEVLNSNTQ